MDALILIGIFICILGISAFLLSFLLLFIAIFAKESRNKIIKIALLNMLFGFIVALVGFGACFAGIAQ